MRLHRHPLALHPSECGRSLPLLWPLPLPLQRLLRSLRQSLHHPAWPQRSQEASAWARGAQRSWRTPLVATTAASIPAASHSDWGTTLMASPALGLFPGPPLRKLQCELRLTPDELAPAVTLRDTHGPPLRTMMHHHPLPFDQPSLNREIEPRRGIRGTLDTGRSARCSSTRGEGSEGRWTQHARSEERLHTSTCPLDIRTCIAQETHVCWSAKNSAQAGKRPGQGAQEESEIAR